MTASPGVLPLLPDSQRELSRGQGAKEELRLTHSPLKTSLRSDFCLRTAWSSCSSQRCAKGSWGPGEAWLLTRPCCAASSSTPRLPGFLAHVPCNEMTLPQAEKHGANVKRPPWLPPRALILLATRQRPAALPAAGTPQGPAAATPRST